MYGLRRFGIKLGLETITSVLAHLDNPQKNYRIIHIAGTNGKGSVAAMLSTILHKAGYCVGRYTSPHLERFNERICINNEPIGDSEVISAYEKVRSAPTLDRELTFFEFSTAMALYAFNQRKVEWAVIETGMGGRLDATNAVCPQLTIITNISLEHRAYLGKTLADIAYEKAGIIKSNIPLVTGVSQRNARNTILDIADRNHAPTLLRGRDFRSRRVNPKQFSYYGVNQTWRNIDLALCGNHQVDNAALVLAACETLEKAGNADLSEETIRQGLLDTYWPGRLEVVSTRPYLILDGAHNLMAARRLAQFLKDQFKGQNTTLVVGVLDDKPCESILKDLIAPCRKVVVTQPIIDRAIPAYDLAQIALKYNSAVEMIPNVGKAVEHALSKSEAEDVVCVAGSLYVVGEAKTALRRMGITEANASH
jgi:dihydrofolate synthase/folylpolyglutamate synthase